jgi:hypothetical protein
LYHRTDYKTYEEQLEIARRMRETAYPSLELRREARHASVSGMLRQQFASEPNPVTAFFPREVLDPVQQQRYDGLENYRDQCARLLALQNNPQLREAEAKETAARKIRQAREAEEARAKQEQQQKTKSAPAQKNKCCLM